MRCVKCGHGYADDLDGCPKCAEWWKSLRAAIVSAVIILWNLCCMLVYPQWWLLSAASVVAGGLVFFGSLIGMVLSTQKTPKKAVAPPVQPQAPAPRPSREPAPSVDELSEAWFSK